MVICLQRDADLHMAQLMPLSLTVSCFSKIQTGFTFLVAAHPGSPGQRAVERVCVCVSVCVCLCVCLCVCVCVCLGHFKNVYDDDDDTWRVNRCIIIILKKLLKNHPPSVDIPYPCTGVLNPLKFVHYQSRRRRRAGDWLGTDLRVGRSVVHDASIDGRIQFALVGASCLDEVGRFSRDRQRRLGVCRVQHVTCPHERHKVAAVRAAPVFDVAVLGSCITSCCQFKLLLLHSPTYTHPDHQRSFINFLHLLRSISSSLFNFSA